MLTNYLKMKTVQLSARVAPLVKNIIRAEVLARKMKSEAEFIEFAVCHAAECAESIRLMTEEVRGDPRTAAVLSALGISLPAKKQKEKRAA